MRKQEAVKKSKELKKEGISTRIVQVAHGVWVVVENAVYSVGQPTPREWYFA